MSLNKISSQRISGIIIDILFSSHIENITNECKRVYNRLTLFPDMHPGLAIQILKSFICSKLEYGSTIWGHTTKHLRFLKVAQKQALMLILRVMKSNPFGGNEAELCIAPIDLRLQE